MSGRKSGGGRGRGVFGRVTPSLPAPGASSSPLVPEPEVVPLPGDAGREMVWDTQSTRSSVEGREPVAFAKRPSQPGRDGKEVALRINMFEVTLNYDGLINLYQVDFQTARDSKPLLPEQKRAVVWGYLKDFFGQEFAQVAPRYAYDGAKCLYAIDKLDLIDKEVGLDKGCRMRTVLPNEFGTSPFIVRFNWLGTASASGLNLRQLLLSPDKCKATPLSLIDAVIRQSPCHPILQQRFVTIGNNFYQIPIGPDTLIDLSVVKRRDGTYPLISRYSLFGASVNTRVGLNGKAYINVDTANAVFYQPQTCMEFMVNALNEAKSSNVYKIADLHQHSELEPMDRDILRRSFKGMKVNMLYFSDDQKHRTRTVTKIGDSARDTSFELNEGERITVEQYFLTRHGVTLNYPKLPVLVFGTGRRSSSVPMEVCKIAPYQRTTRTLPEECTSIMIKALCTKAPDRVAKIVGVADGSNLGGDDWCRTFGVARDHEMARVRGRVLTAPVLQHGANRRMQPFNGVWADKPPLPPMANPKNIASVVVVRMCDMRELSDDNIFQLVSVLYRTASGLGFRTPGSNQVNETPIINVTRANMEDRFPSAVKAALIEKNASLLIVIMSGRNSQTYGFVKRFCETKESFASQCLLVKNCKPFLKPMTAFNLLLKINVKLGGFNWLAAQEQDDCKDIMIVGMDVSHPGGRDQRVPSLAAIVGSLENPARYGATVKVNRSGKETVNYIREATQERLAAYHKVNGRYPKSVIVFRDGVAQTMFQKTLQEELNAMQDAVTDLGFTEASDKIKFTFIVCQKRHHTRLFCENNTDQCGRSQNVPPGTLVDTEVVDDEHFDYFLCSHFGIQGTSRPCHYTVLYDDNNYSAEYLEQLSYRLCHLYARCCRSVSIPAPVYYADKVAERAKLHLLEYLSKLQAAPQQGPRESGSIQSERQSSMERRAKVTDEIQKTMYFC